MGIFNNVFTKFLGKRRSPNYEDMVYKLMPNFQDLGARMPPRMHFLNSHLDYFPENYGSCGEEQGERFHQDIRMMQERNQGRLDINMLADYCWCLKRDIPVPQHKRKAFKRPFAYV